MLSVQEASQRLRVSASLIYTLCSRGAIPHYRCGLGRGTIRIDEKDLDAYLERSKVVGHPPVQRASVKQFKQLDPARLAQAWKNQGIL